MSSQRILSGKIKECQFSDLYDSVSPADKVLLLSVSSIHASAWLSVVPSSRLNLSLEPSEFHTAIKWWLGIPVSGNHSCPYCPSHALDPHNHHALTCKYGGDVVNWHNRLIMRDILLESCHRACLSPMLEAVVWDMKDIVRALMTFWSRTGN